MGAFVAPLVATQFATRPHWYYHYIISVGISCSNVACLYFVFRFRSQDGEFLAPLRSSCTDEISAETLAKEGQAAGEADNASQNKYRQILNLRIIHFLSIFALIYVGVEVTLGGTSAFVSGFGILSHLLSTGWIVTFIQQKRGGGASAGYISAGFFGGQFYGFLSLRTLSDLSTGIMLGRVGLMWLTKLVCIMTAVHFHIFAHATAMCRSATDVSCSSTPSWQYSA